jgi:hypothetical protein
MTRRVVHKFLGPVGDSLSGDQMKTREAAEIGSRKLLLAIEDMFDNFARKHRVSYIDARTLLLDTGVRL